MMAPSMLMYTPHIMSDSIKMIPVIRQATPARVKGVHNMRVYIGGKM